MLFKKNNKLTKLDIDSIQLKYLYIYNSNMQINLNKKLTNLLLFF